jgi:HAMP domain-containing protein
MAGRQLVKRQLHLVASEIDLADAVDRFVERRLEQAPLHDAAKDDEAGMQKAPLNARRDGIRTSNGNYRGPRLL